MPIPCLTRPCRPGALLGEAYDRRSLGRVWSAPHFRAFTCSSGRGRGPTLLGSDLAKFGSNGRRVRTLAESSRWAWPAERPSAVQGRLERPGSWSS